MKPMTHPLGFDASAADEVRWDVQIDARPVARVSGQELAVLLTHPDQDRSRAGMRWPAALLLQLGRFIELAPMVAVWLIVLLAWCKSEWLRLGLQALSAGAEHAKVDLLTAFAMLVVAFSLFALVIKDVFLTSVLGRGSRAPWDAAIRRHLGLGNGGVLTLVQVASSARHAAIDQDALDDK